MMTAKAQGKNQIVVFDDRSAGRPDGSSDGRDARALAHLRLLQTLIGRLGRLGGAGGRRTADRRGGLPAWRRRRLSRLRRPGRTARGDRLGGSAHLGSARLRARGRPRRQGRQQAVGRSSPPPPTPGLPGVVGLALSRSRWTARVGGVVVVTRTQDRRLGDHDLRLLEVLAGPAAVALENARLYQAARRDAGEARAELARLRATSAPA